MGRKSELLTKLVSEIGLVPGGLQGGGPLAIAEADEKRQNMSAELAASMGNVPSGFSRCVMRCRNAAKQLFHRDHSANATHGEPFLGCQHIVRCRRILHLSEQPIRRSLRQAKLDAGNGHDLLG